MSAMKRQTPKVQSVTIRGKRYRVRFRRLPGVWGQCDHPATPKKTITIDPDMSGFDALDTAVHELLHGGMWELREDVVAELSSDIARALWRMGFRHIDDIESHG